MFYDHQSIKECEVCGNQAIAPCAGCGKWVCVAHGTKKVEANEEVALYCDEHK